MLTINQYRSKKRKLETSLSRLEHIIKYVDSNDFTYVLTSSEGWERTRKVNCVFALRRAKHELTIEYKLIINRIKKLEAEECQIKIALKE